MFASQVSAQKGSTLALKYTLGDEILKADEVWSCREIATRHADQILCKASVEDFAEILGLTEDGNPIEDDDGQRQKRAKKRRPTVVETETEPDSDSDSDSDSDCIESESQSDLVSGGTIPRERPRTEAGANVRWTLPNQRLLDMAMCSRDVTSLETLHARMGRPAALSPWHLGLRLFDTFLIFGMHDDASRVLPGDTVLAHALTAPKWIEAKVVSVSERDGGVRLALAGTDQGVDVPSDWPLFPHPWTSGSKAGGDHSAQAL